MHATAHGIALTGVAEREVIAGSAAGASAGDFPVVLLLGEQPDDEMHLAHSASSVARSAAMASVAERASLCAGVTPLPIGTYSSAGANTHRLTCAGNSCTVGAGEGSLEDVKPSAMKVAATEARSAVMASSSAGAATSTLGVAASSICAVKTSSGDGGVANISSASKRCACVRKAMPCF